MNIMVNTTIAATFSHTNTHPPSALNHMPCVILNLRQCRLCINYTTIYKILQFYISNIIAIIAIKISISIIDTITIFTFVAIFLLNITTSPTIKNIHDNIISTTPNIEAGIPPVTGGTPYSA